jgi:cytochrome b
MRTVLVYDLPTRIFHWLFSGLFLLSFIIAKTTDDESNIFIYHMLSGFLLTTLVLWRLFWGFAGSKTSRFSSFNFNLLNLKKYLMDILSGTKKHWSGRNPASSWATILMLLLALGLAITGYLMTTGSRDSFKEIHEFMAHSFIVIVVLHVAGVVLHSQRYQDGIALSMVDGKKDPLSVSDSIFSHQWLMGFFLVALMAVSGVYLFNKLDMQNKTLQIFNSTLQFGEHVQDNDDD